MTNLTEQSTRTKMRILLCGLLLLFIALPTSLAAFGSNKDRVLLSDIHTLTLYNGRMTNGRRSSPVPQLKCVGGSAAGAFVPQVVQCTNKGSDGYDAQWECKTDMDNAFRFGNVEVTCEGYDYPDDPYVLRGSCGLEYTLDYTKEGYQQQHHSGHHDYYGNQDYQQHHNTYNTYKNSYARKAGSVMGDLVFLGVVAIIIYVIYKTCIASNRHATGDNHDNSNRFGNERRPPPPPYGFKDDYTQGDSYSSTYAGTNTGTHSSSTGNTGGGFWSGAFTGGVLGYLFGNRNNYGSQTYYSPGGRGWGGGWNRGWGGNGWGGWGSGWGSSSRSYSTPNYTSRSSGFSSGSSSSGTRTASGFGGTKRR